jgi:uncharacterized protein (TIGR03435 family)
MLWCEPPAQAQAFEVVSVKRHLDSTSFGAVVIHLNPPKPQASGRRFTARVASVQDLIVEAYDLNSYSVIGLPDWAKAGREHYDVDAVVPGDDPTTSNLRLMLQSMLADRFQLKTHREIRELPIYLLKVAKDGPKFKEVAGEAALQSPTIFLLTESLSAVLDHPVVDRTGLTGSYGFSLPNRDLRRAGLDSAPSISAYLKDHLGLQLEAKKESIEVLVVDHVERPSAN